MIEIEQWGKMIIWLWSRYSSRKFLYPLSKLQLLLEENYRNYIR